MSNVGERARSLLKVRWVTVIRPCGVRFTRVQFIVLKVSSHARAYKIFIGWWGVKDSDVGLNTSAYKMIFSKKKLSVTIHWMSSENGHT